MMQALSATKSASMSLEAQLDLIKNVDKYTDRLNELRNAEAEAQTAIAKLTKAKDLDAALKRAEQAELQATQAQTEAERKAEQIIRDAEANAAQIIEDVNDKIEITVNQLREKQVELNGLQAQATLLAQQIEAMGDRYNELVQDVRAKEAEKDKLLATINDKKRRLQELLAQ